MTTNYNKAVDEINAEFWASWNSAKTVLIAGYVPPVRWQGVQEPDRPDSSKFWARVAIDPVFEEQTALAGNQATGRYTTSGLVVISIFCPSSDPQASESGRRFAEVAKDAFRGKSTTGGVWFRNVRMSDVGQEALFYVFEVVAEFEYDEIVEKQIESGFVSDDYIDGGTFN